KWKANASGTSATSFDLYIFLPAFTNNSHYWVTKDSSATWTHVGAVGQTDPGNASSSVLIPVPEFDLPQGKVGIGTTSPQAKLEVNGGGVKANGPATAGGSTGFHVFEGNYTSGTASNFLGTGSSANLYNVAGMANRHSGFGVFAGDNIVSPMVWM